MWFVFAFAAAIFATLERTLMKSAVVTATDRTIVYTRYLVASGIAVGMLLFIPVPSIAPAFYPSALFGCLADVAAIVFMSRSLRHSSMSRVVPLLSFTPVFLLFSGFIVLGETPSLLGIIGVVIVVSGSYVLHIERSQQSLWQPLHLLLQDRGARYMFITAFCFSIAVPFFKNAILHSSALFALGTTLPFSTLLLSVYHLIFRRRSLGEILPNAASMKSLITLGVTVFCVALSVNLAFTTGLVSYVVSIKRLSILFNIIVGFLFFQEKRLLQNLSAGGIMILGAILILLH